MVLGSKRKFKNQCKSTNGITLVALSVTILLLIILVSVTVKIAVDNGLIGNTKTVAESYERQQARERLLVLLEEQRIKNVQNKIRNKEDKLNSLENLKDKDGVTDVTRAEDTVKVIIDGEGFVVDENLNIINPDDEKPDTNITNDTNTSTGNNTTEDPGTKSASYTIIRYIETIDGEYTIYETETKTGTIGSTVIAEEKKIEGFTLDKTNPNNNLADRVVSDGSLVLQAYYTRQIYTITLDTGTEIKTITKKYEEPLGDLPTVEKAGYTLEGWYSDEALTNKVETEYTVTGDITLYANWTANEYTLTVEPGTTTHTQDYNSSLEVTAPVENYTVSFNTNGGTTLENIAVAREFTGWTLEGKGSLSSTTSNPTTFTFGAGDSKLTANYGNGRTTLPTPTKEGYTFEGWYSDETLTNKVETEYTVTGDITLYANWTANEYTLTVEPGTITHTQDYNSNIEVTAPVQSYTVSFNTNGGATLENIAVAREFTGWTLEGKGSISSTTSNPTTFTFGAGDSKLTASYGNGKVTLPTVEKEGYTFEGWYSDEALTTKVGNAGEEVTVTGDITLYANWTANEYTLTVEPGTITHTQDYNSNIEVTAPVQSYTVSFNTNGGATLENIAVAREFTGWTLEGKGSISSTTSNPTIFTFGAGDGKLTANYEDKTTILPEVEKEGYTFEGWYSDEALTTKVGNAGEEFAVAGNITLYAKYTANPYTLTINLTEGGIIQGEGITDNHGIYLYGTKVILTANADEGYSFAGKWTLNGIEEDKVTKSGNTITFDMPANDVTIAANFVKNSHQLVTTWNPSEGGNVIGQGKYEYGTKVVLTANANPGYHFVNWAVTSGTIRLTEEQKINPSIDINMPDEEVTIHATFARNIHTVTATVDADQILEGIEVGTITAEGMNDNRGSYEYGTEVTLTANANRGYTLSDWSFSKEEIEIISQEGNSITFMMPDENITVTANFHINRHMVTTKVTPEEIGKVIGEGCFAYGTQVTLTANANIGYVLDDWSFSKENVEIISQEGNSITFIMPDEEITVTAEMIENMHDVIVTTTPSKGGFTTGAGRYQEGEQVSLVAEANTGYRFSKWIVTNGNVSLAEETNPSITITMPGEDINLTAKFEPITYTIHYDGNGATNGSTADSQHIYDVEKKLTQNGYGRQYTVMFNTNGGTEVSNSTAHYQFGGWKTDPEGNNKNYEDREEVRNLSSEDKSTVILYAHWTGGRITLPTLEEVSKTGYTLEGWYSDEALTKKQGNPGTECIITEDTTLYAKWIEAPVDYQIHTYLENANDDGYSFLRTRTLRAETGTIITLENEKEVMADYTYSHGKDSLTGENLETTTVAADGSTNIYLYYKRNQYHLTIATNNEGYFTETVGEGTYKWGQSVSIEAVIAKESDEYTYSWENWTSNNTSLIGNQSSQKTNITMPKGDITLTANATRTAKTYTVTYDAGTNGGIIGNNATLTRRVQYGNTVDLSVVATKSGWTFVGWATNQHAITKLSSMSMPSNDITVYAIFKKEVTAKFVDYNGTQRRETPKTVTIYNAATTADIQSPLIGTYTNWNSVGWTISETNNTNDTVSEETIVRVNENATPTYYARYDREQKILYYNGNTEVYRETGTVKTNSSNIANIAYPRYTIASASYAGEKTGYTFQEWNSSYYGTGNTFIPDSNGIMFSNSYMISLYAKWNVNTYKITYLSGSYYYDSTGAMRAWGITNNGIYYTGSSEEYYYKERNLEQTYTYGTTLYFQGIEATKEGYSFIGWNTSSSATTGLSNYRVTGNATLYAIFAKEGSVTVNPGGETYEDVPGEKRWVLAPASMTVEYYTSTSSSSRWSYTTTSFKEWKLTGDGSVSNLTSNNPVYTFGQNAGYLQAVYNAVTLPSATKTGYTLEGWYSDTELKNKVGDANETVSLSPDSTPMKLYAKWIPIPYTVYIYPGPTSKTGNYNAKVSISAAQLAIRYHTNLKGQTDTYTSVYPTFKSWSKGSYGSIGSTTSANTTYTFGTGTGYVYANYNAVTLPNFTKSGYKLEGWYSNSNLSSSNRVGSPGDTYAIPSNPTASSINLYPNWLSESVVAMNVNTSTYYESIQEAVDSVSGNQTVKVMKDVTESGITVSADKTLALDLNGKTITGNITNNGTLTIKGEQNGSKITNTGTPITTKRSFTLESGTIEGSTGITVQSQYPYTETGIVIKNGLIQAKQRGIYCAQNGSANSTITIEVQGGKIEVTGGTAVTDYEQGSVGIYLRQNTSSRTTTSLNISGGDIYGEYSGIDLDNNWNKLNPTFNVTITGGKVRSDNIGVYMTNENDFTMTGGEIDSNGTGIKMGARTTSAISGGIIKGKKIGLAYYQAKTLTISGNTIIYSSEGRGISMTGGGTNPITVSQNVKVAGSKYSIDAGFGTLSLSGNSKVYGAIHDKRNEVANVGGTIEGDSGRVYAFSSFTW